MTSEMLPLVLGVITILGGAWLEARRWQTSSLSPEAERRMARRLFRGGALLLPVLNVMLLLLVGVPVAQHLLILHGKDALPIELTASCGGWQVYYPDAGLRRRDELRLPSGRWVVLQVASADVMHSLWIPQLGARVDAIPGRTTTLRLRAERAGSLYGGGTEYCGAGHSPMAVRIEVQEPKIFARAIAGPQE